MKLELKSLAYPFQWAYRNPSQASLTAGRSIIALGLGYVAYRQGSQLLGTAKSVHCHLSCTGDAMALAEQAIVTASLCLASVVALRYNSSASKPLPKVPGASER